MGAGQSSARADRSQETKNSSRKNRKQNRKNHNLRHPEILSKSSYNGILPKQKKEDEGKITVVLDMYVSDETLLHSQFETKNNYRQTEERQTAKRPCDFKFQLKLDSNSPPETVKVYKRPGLDEFLSNLSKEFEVVVFTAAVPLYAQPVLDRADLACRIQHRLYRSSTVTFKGQPYYAKGIYDILTQAVIQIVLIDNNPCAMLASPDNVIPIMSFYDSPVDNELPKVQRMLATINYHPFFKYPACRFYSSFVS
ncbi:hypothetical protein AAMO2058_001030900 [Amorphochlora amoebiformis]